ncbi:MAG: hypothetical protein L0287_26550 [Anaerolineae bacterium]|nr:hypothetical protein [Anaerolineae bacterium]MCI0610261.1 hypothetical protein [Anaerolineae bacterium]
MNEQGYTGVIRRFFRAVILIDTSLAVIVGLISFLLCERIRQGPPRL